MNEYLEAKFKLLGEKVTFKTQEPCAERLQIGSGLEISYNLIWQSSEAVARYCESCV